MNAEAKLTKREAQVGKLLAWGACKKTVADRLFISVHTVENHVRNIFVKTECRSVNEFSAWYFCTHFGISMELSPLRNVIAIFLLTIYLSGDVTHNLDIFTKTRSTRTTAIIRKKVRNNREELDYIFPEIT